MEPLGALQEEQGGRVLDPGQPDLREPAIQEEEEEIEEEAHGDEEDAGEEEKEVTVQYAVEGTPFAFSRAESLSDLEEVEVGEGKGAKLQAIPETGSRPPEVRVRGCGDELPEGQHPRSLLHLHLPLRPRQASMTKPDRKAPNQRP